jgi:hypothetical protein
MGIEPVANKAVDKETSNPSHDIVDGGVADFEESKLLLLLPPLVRRGGSEEEVNLGLSKIGVFNESFSNRSIFS